MVTFSKPVPMKPKDADPLKDKIEWLVRTHGFDARGDQVVMLYEPSVNCSMRLKAFETEYAAWFELQPQQTGKPKKLSATTAWAMHPRRESIAGIHMRPDKNFPTYLEDGEVFKNTYRRPVHADADIGEVQTFLDFLDRFIPGVDENDYWLEWLSHKWQWPEVPGCSPVFVADGDSGPREGQFGTGRGMMARVCMKLLGEAYTIAEDFNVLTGESGQAVYTDWQAERIAAFVDEAHTSPNAHRKNEKRSMFTALKNCIDPAAKRRSFKSKYGKRFDGISYCSVVIFSNHSNAIPIPENDRRFSVLQNGLPMTPDEAKVMNAWINGPGNIAALARYLEKIDLSQFDMYTPLKTAAKTQMAEKALSHMDEIFEDFAEDDDRGLVFPRLFLEQAVERHLNGGGERMGGGREWRGHFAGAFDDHCVPVRPNAGTVKARVRVNGERYRLYCFKPRSKTANTLNETERRIEAAKWGTLDTTQTILRSVMGEAVGPDNNENSEPSEDAVGE